MNSDPDFQALAGFVAARISDRAISPPVTAAAQAILTMAVNSQDADAADYAGGYADAAEDALRAISGVWRYHPEYGQWAHDDD